MKRPWISLSWWDWGRSGPQRHWDFPKMSHRKRVSASLRLGPLYIGTGRSYTFGGRYFSIRIKDRSLVNWSEVTESERKWDALRQKSRSTGG